MGKEEYEQIAECYGNIIEPLLKINHTPDSLNPRHLIYTLMIKRKQLYEKYKIHYTNVTLADDFSISPRTLNRLNKEFG